MDSSCSTFLDFEAEEALLGHIQIDPLGFSVWRKDVEEWEFGDRKHIDIYATAERMSEALRPPYPGALAKELELETLLKHIGDRAKLAECCREAKFQKVENCIFKVKLHSRLREHLESYDGGFDSSRLKSSEFHKAIDLIVFEMISHLRQAKGRLRLLEPELAWGIFEEMKKRKGRAS
jgi:replicative DNA helicase